MSESTVTKSELQTAFQSLQSNKSAGVDEISVNVVKHVFDIIESPLHHIFDLSLKTGKFPYKLKIARVTPIFKSGDDSNVTNYRPISVLPCFSKLLERIMYNRLYKHLTENDMLYSKQFGFQKRHSTDHAVIELINDITNAFDNNCFSLGVFIDLSKAFDTVNHDILMTKLEHYGIKNKNLLWFRDYLTNRKQCIYYGTNTTLQKRISCGVPQGSILGPLLFLLYINDLHSTSTLLNFILFADDSNLFYSHKDIKTLFKIVNEELIKVDEWFKSNKLSLNIKKTKYTLFFKPTKADDIPFKLPNFLINDTPIERQTSMKFLGVLLDENLSWRSHIQTIENKISKNIAMLYKVKALLNLKSLKSLYFCFVHSYLTYCNIAWASTNHTKLKKLYNKQKHACRVIFGADRSTPSEPLLRELRVLNIYKLNIHQVLLFMFKTKHGLSPKTFDNHFFEIRHKYGTRFSENNFVVPKFKLKLSTYSIRYRGPYLWNNFLSDDIKRKNTLEKFKSESKRLLLITDLVVSQFF